MTGSSTRLGHRSLPRVSKRRELPRGSHAGGARAQRPGPHYSAALAAGAAEAAGAAKAAVFGESTALRPLVRLGGVSLGSSLGDVGATREVPPQRDLPALHAGAAPPALPLDPTGEGARGPRAAAPSEGRWGTIGSAAKAALICC